MEKFCIKFSTGSPAWIRYLFTTWVFAGERWLFQKIEDISGVALAEI